MLAPSTAHNRALRRRQKIVYTALEKQQHHPNTLKEDPKKQQRNSEFARKHVKTERQSDVLLPIALRFAKDRQILTGELQAGG